MDGTVSKGLQSYLREGEDILWSGEPAIPWQARMARMRVNRFVIFGRGIAGLVIAMDVIFVLLGRLGKWHTNGPPPPPFIFFLGWQILVAVIFWWFTSNLKKASDADTPYVYYGVTNQRVLYLKIAGKSQEFQEKPIEGIEELHLLAHENGAGSIIFANPSFNTTQVHDNVLKFSSLSDASCVYDLIEELRKQHLTGPKL